MSKKTIILIGAVLLLLVAAGGGYYFYNKSSADTVLAADGSSMPADSITAEDDVLGNPNAPVTVIEYFAQACSVCAHFDQDVFPQVKAKYIDTGKVRWVMRLFPLFPIDGPSYKLDRCMPKDKFFQAADLLFRNQTKWDSGEYPVADPHAGLIQMARILGMDAAQADACMNSTKEDDRINKVAQDATTRYQPNGTPTFVIDYKKVVFPGNSFEEMKAALDAALAAKGAK